jgi:glycosyltransferase involved in cell wall biosynthesis
MRLLLLTEIPAPFRIPAFNALADTHDVELAVVVISEHDPRRRYDVDASSFRFDYRVLHGRSVERRGRWLVLSRGLRRVLGEAKPDAIIVGGWNQPAFWQALVTARLRRIPSLLWVESTARDARIGHPAAQGLRRLALALATGFIVPGKASADYLEGLGVDASRIAIAANTVEPGLTGNVDRESARNALGLEGCVFLYVGRLEHEKGPDVLVEAMHDVPARLVVVGDGSMREELQRIAPEGRVLFAGHVARPELGNWYAASDVLVFPSRSDTWGMVLNEAATAGLPLIASEVAGGAYDLIEPGVNGHIVPTQDPAALARIMSEVAVDPEWREAAGTRSRQLAEPYFPDSWAASVAGFVASLVRRRADALG